MLIDSAKIEENNINDEINNDEINAERKKELIEKNDNNKNEIKETEEIIINKFLLLLNMPPYYKLFLFIKDKNNILINKEKLIEERIMTKEKLKKK